MKSETGKKSRVRRFGMYLRRTVRPEAILAGVVSFGASTVWCQSSSGPVGLTGICAAKNWAIGLAGVLAIAGVTWHGLQLLTSMRHGGEGMHSITEKIPGMILTFLPAGIAGWFGLALC
jgi:hypothetical protein